MMSWDRHVMSWARHVMSWEVANSPSPSLLTMQFYAGGVFLEPTCSRTRLTQSVLIIGYGRTRSGRDYWILKNRYYRGSPPIMMMHNNVIYITVNVKEDA